MKYQVMQHKQNVLMYTVVVQLVSHDQLFATSWTAAHQASLSFNSWTLLKLMSVESVMPSNHLILCCPLLLLLQSFPASGSFQISLSYSSIISRKHPTSLSKQSYVWFPTLPTHSNNLNNLSLTKCRDEAPWPHQLN